MNKYRGVDDKAKVKLGTNEFQLKYDMNALCVLEKELGEPVSNVLMAPNAEERLGVSFIRAALYAGMIWDKRISRGITIEKVGSLMRIEDMADYIPIVIRGIIVAMGVDPDAADAAMSTEATEEIPLGSSGESQNQSTGSNSSSTPSPQG